MVPACKAGRGRPGLNRRADPVGVASVAQERATSEYDRAVRRSKLLPYELRQPRGSVNYGCQTLSMLKP